MSKRRQAMPKQAGFSHDVSSYTSTALKHEKCLKQQDERVLDDAQF